MAKRLFLSLLFCAGLTFSAIAQHTTVNLTWNASTDNIAVAGYNVYRNGVKIGTSTTTSYTDTTANSTTQYDYTVSAFDAAGNESGKSIAATVKPPPTADTAPRSVPTNLTAATATEPPSGVEVAGPSAALFAAPYYTCTRNFYVATNGNDSRTSTQAQSSSTPWLTIQHANDSGALRAGDCVNVAPGTYSSRQINITAGGNAASATGYVVYRSSTMGAAHLIANQSAPNAFFGIPGNYVMVDGFEIDCNNNIAQQGITTGDNTGGVAGHHLWMTNNKIHDCGLSGIQTGKNGEWYWILHNELYGNSSTSGYMGSGISIYEPGAVTPYTPTAMDNQWSPYHIVINYNISRDNFNAQGAFGYTNTDGNGIILDDWSSHFRGGSYVRYTVPGLVFGNVTYHNGGRGIQVVYGVPSNTLVANNTAYNNNWDLFNPGTPRGEITDYYNYNVIFKNNVAYQTPFTDPIQLPDSTKRPYGAVRNIQWLSAGSSTPDCPSGCTATANPPTFTSNVSYGSGVPIADSPAVYSCSANKCSSDPLFANAAANNFALKAGSPALGYVTPLTLPSAVTAIPDAGACSHTVTTCP
jgi:chitodextrinase